MGPPPGLDLGGLWAAKIDPEFDPEAIWKGLGFWTSILRGGPPRGEGAFHPGTRALVLGYIYIYIYIYKQKLESRTRASRALNSLGPRFGGHVRRWEELGLHLKPGPFFSWVGAENWGSQFRLTMQAEN